VVVQRWGDSPSLPAPVGPSSASSAALMASSRLKKPNFLPGHVKTTGLLVNVIWEQPPTIVKDWKPLLIYLVSNPSPQKSSGFSRRFGGSSGSTLTKTKVFFP